MPQSRSFRYDVFLSHNSKDKPQVRKLAQRLRDAGLRVWFDEWVIKPGDDIYLAIERGLETSRILVLCLSAAALASDWVAQERSAVLFRDPTNTHRRFIPLLLTDCDLPDTLRCYKYVDFRQETPSAFDELFTLCRVEPPPSRTESSPAEFPAADEGHDPRLHGEAAECYAWRLRRFDSKGYLATITAERIAQWRAAADAGMADAQWLHGQCLEYGMEVAEDLDLAIQYYARAAAQGHAHALCSLGAVHDNAPGHKRQIKKALEWFRLAWEGGDAEAASHMGSAFFQGWVGGLGTDDDAEALTWFRRAAERGHAGAMAMVGLFYSRGQYVAKDDQAALDWVRRSAQLGNNYGRYLMGCFLLNGTTAAPVAKDQACLYFEPAAREGYYFAELALAGMYEQGDGVPKDLNTAVDWYLKAARDGGPICEARSALHRLQREGVPAADCAVTELEGSY
jgi:TPR repeat protein